MKEINGNIWDEYDKGRWIVITVNGTIRKDGACVMGRGIAKQVAIKFPKFPYILGAAIRKEGNNLFVFGDFRIITFPVKHHWKEQADLELIEKSLKQLVDWADNPRKHGKFYIVRAGVGNGCRDWETEVKPLYEKYLDDRFVVVEWR